VTRLATPALELAEARAVGYDSHSWDIQSPGETRLRYAALTEGRRCIEAGGLFVPAAVESLRGKIMKWEKLFLSGRDRIGDGFKTLVDCKVRERRQDERRLAQHRRTKHHLQARKSCVADARGYRIASRQFKRWLMQSPVALTRIQVK